MSPDYALVYSIAKTALAQTIANIGTEPKRKPGPKLGGIGSSRESRFELGCGRDYDQKIEADRVHHFASTLSMVCYVSCRKHVYKCHPIIISPGRQQRWDHLLLFERCAWRFD